MSITTLAVPRPSVVGRLARLAEAAARFPMSVWRFCIERRIRNELLRLHAALDDRTLESFGLRRDDIEDILARFVTRRG